MEFTFNSYIGKLRNRIVGRLRRHVERRARTRYVLRRLKALPPPPEPGVNEEERILFFSPETGFKASGIIQSVLARTLKDLKNSVVMARCFRLFERDLLVPQRGAP